MRLWTSTALRPNSPAATRRWSSTTSTGWAIISHITSILAINQINIVTVVNSRDSTGKKAVTMIETETLVDTSVKKELESMSAVESVVTMEKVS